MRIEVTMTERGGITIPAALRKVFGLTGNSRLIVEDTAEGLLLRPAISVPIETYTEERIAEFAKDEEALGRYFADKTGDDGDRCEGFRAPFRSDH